MHGEKYSDADPLSCVAFPRSRNVFQCVVLQLVLIFSGVRATTLGLPARGFACGFDGTIEGLLHKRGLRVVKKQFVWNGLEESIDVKKVEEREHAMERSMETLAMTLSFYSRTLQTGKAFMWIFTVFNSEFLIERPRQRARRQNKRQSLSFFVFYVSWHFIYPSDGVWQTKKKASQQWWQKPSIVLKSLAEHQPKNCTNHSGTLKTINRKKAVTTQFLSIQSFDFQPLLHHKTLCNCWRNFQCYGLSKLCELFSYIITQSSKSLNDRWRCEWITFQSKCTASMRLIFLLQ